MMLSNGLSALVRLLGRLGLHGMAWSVRRLRCPVDKYALVLKVGSGGGPYFRSNVVLDVYEETCKRHWMPLILDRQTVQGFVESCLPVRRILTLLLPVMYPPVIASDK